MDDSVIEFCVRGCGREGVARISSRDSDLLRYTWRIDRKGYLIRTTRKKSAVRPGCGSRTILLHREVAADLLSGCPDMQVDHVNGDKLDCRRENLDIVTNQENAIRRSVRNRSSQKENKP